VPVSRDESEVVFEDQRCDPEIIVGNRRAGSPELNEDPRIVFRCLPAGRQHANGRFGELPVQQTLIATLLRATEKPGLDLARCEKRNPDFLRGTQLLRQI
jgi:hypothetical protein